MTIKTEQKTATKKRLFIQVKEGDTGLETYIDPDFFMQSGYLRLFQVFLEEALNKIKITMKEVKKKGL